MIALSLMSVGMVEETASVIVILRAPDQGRLLVMEVGLLEGRAIALEAEGAKTPRPLTHELTHRVLDALGGTVAQVVIREFREKTFYADLALRSADGRDVVVDARPSDAIALALRSGAPIFAAEAVLAAAGIDEDEIADEEEDWFGDAEKEEGEGEAGPESGTGNVLH